MEFVNFEIAEKLKEKGFTLPKSEIIGKFDSDGLFHSQLYINYTETMDLDEIIAPTITQVLKWLREEKEIFIAINIGYCYESCQQPFRPSPKMEPIFKGYYFLKGYYYSVWDLGNLNAKNICSEYFESPELATIAGIEYVLDNLI